MRTRMVVPYRFDEQTDATGLYAPYDEHKFLQRLVLDQQVYVNNDDRYQL